MGNRMKLAYSTYGLQTEDPLEAVDRVQAIGYDALELNVGDAWLDHNESPSSSNTSPRVFPAKPA